MKIDLSQLITAEDKTAQVWARLRAERDRRLAACDWTVLPDAAPQPSLQAWLDYRQALRDLPEIVTDPNNVTWPEAPQ